MNEVAGEVSEIMEIHPETTTAPLHS